MDDDAHGPHWQYCRGDYDITNDFYAEQDADEVRVWDGEICLLAVVRDGGCWRIDSSDLYLPDDTCDRRFRTPASALDWLAAARDSTPHPTGRHDAPGADDADDVTDGV